MTGIGCRLAAVPSSVAADRLAGRQYGSDVEGAAANLRNPGQQCRQIDVNQKQDTDAGNDDQPVAEQTLDVRHQKADDAGDDDRMPATMAATTMPSSSSGEMAL